VGTSTLVEGIAMAYGLGSEGGSRGVMHSTRGGESPLHHVLQLVRSGMTRRWGFSFYGPRPRPGRSAGALCNPLPAAHGTARRAHPRAGPGRLRRDDVDAFELLEHWRRYLSEPQAYLHHVLPT
jgi:hypothetical protein